MSKPEVHYHAQKSNLPARIPRRYGRTRGVRAPEDLPIDFEDQMEDLGRQGFSITEARARFDIGASLWSKWYREWPDFHEIVNRFLTLAEAFWLAFGRDNLGNKFFNAGLYTTCMAMRFKHARHLERYIEDTSSAEDTKALEREEDIALADLFSGGDGNPVVKAQRRAPEPMPTADDAQWMDNVDLRTIPK